MIKQAELSGFRGQAFEQVLVTSECHPILRAEMERCVEHALDESDQYREKFLFDLARLMNNWGGVFSQEDHLWIANQLRGTSVLKDMAGAQCLDNQRFDEQVWWPS